jgi:cysteine-rich repeat protein
VQSEYGEACDDGVNDGGYGECAVGCQPGPHCGDNVVQSAYEECDDGNTVSGDGCSSACRSEVWVPA